MAIAIAISAALQSCGTSVGESITLTKSKIESRLASQGEYLMDNMIDCYKQQQDMQFDSEYEDAVAGLLSQSGQEYQPSQLVDQEARQKLHLLYLYKQALHEYALLADEGFTGKQAAFATCSKSILEAFHGFGDTTAYTKAQPLENHIKSTRYDENAVASYLQNGLSDMWSKDVSVWHKSLGESFSEFQSSVSSIPDDAFNEEKLLKYVYQPYEGKHNLAEIYKLNLIKERRDLLSTFENRIDNITSALQYLGLALTELQKKSFDKDVIINYANRIQVLLGPSEPDSKGQ